MKVRVIELPDGEYWRVEVRKWIAFIPFWESAFPVFRTKEDALAYAKRLKNPEIIEV